jgi:septal ring factor EnvC (AmiA/AmiB activator)
LIQNQPIGQGPTPAPAAPLARDPYTGDLVLAPGAPSASAIYEGFRAQRRELTNQLDELESTRREITSQMEDVSTGATDRKALETRMTDIDARIATVDKMLAANAAQIAQAAAMPGAVVEPPPFVRQGPPQEAYVVGIIFMVIALLPLSIALARRIWRRSAAVVTSFPRELADRLSRMEQAVEATAVEVERIGEGQRFLTRLFTEGEGARAIGAGAAQPLERKQANKSPERLP